MATPRPSWTIADVLALADDGNRHELSDGTLLVTPPSTYGHTAVQGRLTRVLNLATPPDLFVNASGAGVKVGDSFFVPDLVVVRDDAEDRTDVLLDPSDVVLAVEVLSPGTRGRDLVLKRAKYAAARIPDYWIVDARARRLTALGLQPASAGYVVLAEVDAGTVYRASRPFPIELDPADFCR